VGRNTEKEHEFIGVDAAIDFPMRLRLVEAVKGNLLPSALAFHFDHRRQVLRKIVSSHGDAARHYVTFLDNHDLNERFHFPGFLNQTKVALACLMSLQGIPCVYYGTELGLSGRGDRREYAREALWGMADAFSQEHPLYQYLQNLSVLRKQQPALRYGRQYFRACSGNGFDFGYSPFKGGPISFSRILNDREVLVVANTHTQQPTTVHVEVDRHLHPEGKVLEILFPFNWQGAAPAPCATRNSRRTVEVTLGPMEVLVLG
jgi:glycosidase